MYNLSGMKNPRHKRLAKEHTALDNLCRRSDVISYEIVGESQPVPNAYLVHYKLKSIVGVDESFNPVFGNLHTIQITLTSNYPVEPARCYAQSDLWHPNIKSEGRHKGRICSNTKEFGKLFSLDMLAIRIGEMLQYKNYHALNTPPYPEDETVARWVREFAEPQNIVNYDKGIYVDDSLLAKSEEEYLAENQQTPEIPPTEEESKPTGVIKIKKSRGADTGHIKIKKKGSDSKDHS